MKLFRRFLVLQALMLWQGGFLFYASFVVPIGTDILGSAGEQGRITREVTNSINFVGCIALLIFAWDWFITRKYGAAHFRLVCWLTMSLMMIGMLYLHPQMDALLDEAMDSILNRKQFRPLHRTYLWFTTIQWAAGVAYTILMLMAWRKEDTPIS
jgi:hypothetical protein